MAVVTLILISLYIIGIVLAWCKKRVRESLVCVQHLSETAIQQQKVIVCQQELIAILKSQINPPTVEMFHTHIFSTDN